MTATLQIKKDRPNYYVLIRYVDERRSKRQKRVSTDVPVKGNNKRKAELRLKEALSAFEKDIKLGIKPCHDTSFVLYMQEWQESMKSSIASTTFDCYSMVFNKHILPYFEPQKINVQELAPRHIQQYINFKVQTLSPNTVIKHLRNLSKCLDSALRQGIIAYNPVKRIEVPKKIKYTGAKHYNESQIEELLEKSKGDPLEMVVLLTVFYGLRRSEALGLKWSAIDMLNDTITIKHTVVRVGKETHRVNATKNDSSYAALPLLSMIRKRLEAWRKEQAEHKRLQSNGYIDEDYVCTRFGGSLITPSYVSHHFKLLLKNNNLPIIRFHDLRHLSAGYLKHLGFDLKDIQVWLRHKGIQTTMNIYVHLDMSAKCEIANTLNDKFVGFD